MFAYLPKDGVYDTRIVFFYEPALGMKNDQIARMTQDVDMALRQRQKIVYMMRCSHCVNRPYNEYVMQAAEVAFCAHCDRQYKGKGDRPSESLRLLFAKVADERRREEERRKQQAAAVAQIGAAVNAKQVMKMKAAMNASNVRQREGNNNNNWVWLENPPQQWR